MIHLKSLRIERPATWPQRFPFNVPIIENMQQLEFANPVTFFVGENGSGKSALLEALACAIGSITAGSESVKTDATLAPARELAQRFRLTWSRRTQKGLFLRAEDFFGYVTRLSVLRAELEQNLNEMAYPGAAILHFNAGSITPVAYEELEHVWLTKSFLNNPQRWLRELFAQEPEP